MNGAAAPRGSLRLTVFGRRYCHLCDDMLAALEAYARDGSPAPFDVAFVDVDADEALETRYGELVPVLAHGERVLCHYFLDRGVLTAYLEAFR